MRRLDRAIFAIFLLALLADVALSQVPAVVAGDSGGLVLTAAGPAREGSGEAGFVVRRASRSSRAYRTYRLYRGLTSQTGFRAVPLASLNGSGWNAGWKRALSSQLSGNAGRLSWTDLAFLPLASSISSEDAASNPELLAQSQPEIASLAVYEHSGNPAP